MSRDILLTSSSHVVPFGGAMSEQVAAAGAGAGAAAGVTTPGVTTGDGNTVCAGDVLTGLAVAVDTGEYATGVGDPWDGLLTTGVPVGVTVGAVVTTGLAAGVVAAAAGDKVAMGVGEATVGVGTGMAAGAGAAAGVGVSRGAGAGAAAQTG